MNEAKSHSPTYLDSGGEGQVDDGTGIWPVERPKLLSRVFEWLRGLMPGSNSKQPRIETGPDGLTDDGTGIMAMPNPDDERSATKPST